MLYFTIASHTDCLPLLSPPPPPFPVSRQPPPPLSPHGDTGREKRKGSRKERKKEE